MIARLYQHCKKLVITNWPGLRPQEVSDWLGDRVYVERVAYLLAVTDPQVACTNWGTIISCSFSLSRFVVTEFSKSML